LSVIFENLFKDLPSLTHIYLNGNKLSAIHPKTFSQVNRLTDLGLEGNICINKRFNPVTSKTEIEQELTSCGAEYSVHYELQVLGEKMDEKFESQKILSEHNRERMETIDGKLKKIDQELATIREKFENVETCFANLEKKFDERNEENAKEIREIKKMVTEMYGIVTGGK
jgi:hypothetical protein